MLKYKFNGFELALY